MSGTPKFKVYAGGEYVAAVKRLDLVAKLVRSIERPSVKFAHSFLVFSYRNQTDVAAGILGEPHTVMRMTSTLVKHGFDKDGKALPGGR